MKQTRKIIKVFSEICPECGKEIIGRTEKHCLSNLGLHRKILHGRPLK